MYSTKNKIKSTIADRFPTTLQNAFIYGCCWLIYIKYIKKYWHIK